MCPLTLSSNLNLTKLPSSKISQRMLALKDSCVHPTSQKPYIKSASGGTDNSPEGIQVYSIFPKMISLWNALKNMPIRANCIYVEWLHPRIYCRIWKHWGQRLLCQWWPFSWRIQDTRWQGSWKGASYRLYRWSIQAVMSLTFTMG